MQLLLELVRTALIQKLAVKHSEISLLLHGVAACKLGLNLSWQELVSVYILLILLIATWSLLFACLLSVVSFCLRLDDLLACAELADSVGPGITEGFVMVVNSENCDGSI